ncbi:somatostatin 1.2 [Gambusia affinis]|uniref:somatostatin 1.2 n=1 Tax=Gambusia affinis TaxID=33528 RepID=UPI001CDB9131|nr:somatostatin 1.2 [Gambusia affinis]
MDFCLTLTRRSFIALQLPISRTESCDPQGGSRPHKSSSSRTSSSEPEPAPGPAGETRPEPSMHHARCPTILVLAALAALSLGVSSQADRDQDPYQNQNLDLDLELRHHRLLQRARSAGLLSQDWSKRAVEDLLAQMSRSEVEAQQDGPEAASRGTGSRLNLERSVETTARERKAGCKNFYWKGLTSC